MAAVAHGLQPLRRHRSADRAARASAPRRARGRGRARSASRSPATGCSRSSSIPTSCSCPASLPGASDSQVTLFQLVQVNRALLFGSMISAMFVARRTDWCHTFSISRIATGRRFLPPPRGAAWRSCEASIRAGRSTISPGFVPFLFYARAALAAPDSPAEPGSGRGPLADPARGGRGRPGLSDSAHRLRRPYFQPLGGAGDSFRALLTGLMTVGGLGLLTLRLAAQGAAAAARGRADAAARGGDRTDGRPDPDHARERRVRARERSLRPRASGTRARSSAACASPI